MKPSVLIATTSRWFPTARLGIALVIAGCQVDAVCPSGHPIRLTTVVKRVHSYHGLSPLISIASAIAASKPDIIVPGDDLAVLHLHQLYYQAKARGAAGAATCALIERSLGAAEHFPVVRSRAAFMNAAEDEGVRSPKTGAISNLAELKAWTLEMGFPVVLKTNGTSGGDGVKIAHSPHEAEFFFRALQAPPLLARAAKRAVVNRDLTLVWPALLRNRQVLSAQTFVAGNEATSAVACWQGTVLASLHFEVLSKHDSTGPSTVLRIIENADMSFAAEKMVRRLGLSGVIGFDFMLEPETGSAYLIEMNPRATQVGHLALGPGRDIAAAMYAAVTGSVVRESPKVTEQDTITLFPHEWLRNPASPYLQSSYHDVPWDEPEFIRVCVRTRRKQKDLYTQQKWVHAFRPARIQRP